MFFMWLLTERGIDVLLETLDNESVSNTTLQTPLWLPQSLWLAGLILFCITLIFVSLFSLLFLLRGNLAMVRRISGALSIEEEIGEETHGLASDRGNRSGEA